MPHAKTVVDDLVDVSMSVSEVTSSQCGSRRYYRVFLGFESRESSPCQSSTSAYFDFVLDVVR